MEVVNQILVGDNREQLRTLPAGIVQCCVTSPPYFQQRDYGVDGQIGLEATPAAYVGALVDVFREVRRVLRDDGTLWVNLGDKYSSSGGERTYGSSDGFIGRGDVASGRGAGGAPAKCLFGMPWRFALAMIDDGWILRSDIIWHKPNPMPGSQRDRPTCDHEYIFLFVKQPRYFCDMEAIKDVAVSEGRIPGGNNKVDASRNDAGRDMTIPVAASRTARTVWNIAVASEKDAHFAVFPKEIPQRCILAGTSEKGQCPKCGAPWERVTETERRATRPGEKTKTSGQNSRANISRDVNHPTELNGKVVGNRDPQRHISETKTLGWQPTCECGETSTVPQLVLDPFGGSGTSAQVARALGRNWLICELNEEYAAIAAKKIRKNPYAEVVLPKVESADGQRELFV